MARRSRRLGQFASQNRRAVRPSCSVSQNNMSEEPKPIGVYDLLAVMLDQCGSVAWQKLGLQPDPITGKIEKDLAEAKIAIDVCAYLSDQLEATLDDDDRREVHNLVRNLRLNYVEKTKDGPS